MDHAPGLGKGLQHHSKKVAEDILVNGPLEGRKPTKIEPRRLNPPVVTKFLRNLIHFDRGSTLPQPAKKISLLLPDKTGALSLFAPDLRRKKITIPVPGLDHFITRWREADFLLDLTK